MINNEFEVLAPAGSFEILKAVIEAGADAVYVGGSQFGARAYANNFNQEEMLEAIDYAHLRNRKVYMTVNTLMKNKEIENQLYDYLLPFYERGLDAIIVQDFGAVSYIRQVFPGLPIHTSTQMTVTGVEGAKLMKELGATRIVTARELSLKEIQAIHEQVDIEIETFVHGALCYCYSGQCLLSSMLGGRSGNRGRCAQPCRLSYSVLDEKKKELLHDSFLLSPKDLCGIDLLPEMNQAGIFSLKIEGRMKQAQYAAGVVAMYRKYVDEYLEKKCLACEHENSKGFTVANYKVSKEDQKRILDLGNRSGFTNSYFTKHNGKDMITFTKPNHQKSNEALQDEIKEKYVDCKSSIAITGKLILRKGENALFEVECGNVTVHKEGPEVMEAMKKPLLLTDVSERFRKTGDTFFAFEDLNVVMDDDVFLPVGAMNQLRRETLEVLQEELLKADRRDILECRKLDADSNSKEQKNSNESGSKEHYHYIASVERRDQISILLKYAYITDVYLDSAAYKRASLWQELKQDVQLIKGKGKKCYYVLPSIFRMDTSEFYKEAIEQLKTCGLDGVVVRNFEELQFIRENQITIPARIDHNMYTYNNYAIHAFSQYGLEGNTIPIELNQKEIKHRNNCNSDMILYGYYPLMTSAQCVHCNTTGCDKAPGLLYLKDRYQKLFPVKNHCNECYNTIYNSLPVMLFGQLDELRNMGVQRFRMNFSIEKENEMKEILSMFEKALNHSFGSFDFTNLEYTNGHYKRGVE